MCARLQQLQFNCFGFFHHERKTLLQHRFGYVWFAQEMGDPIRFLYTFKQRMKDRVTQNWPAVLNNNHQKFTAPLHPF